MKQRLNDDVGPLFWGTVLTATTIIGLQLFILIFGQGHIQ